MSNLISERQDNIHLITFNRVEKHNAFDEDFLNELDSLIKNADNDEQVQVIVIKANGKNFSAGADLAGMQKIVNFSQQENIEDAQILANTLHTIYSCKTPTIAMVQGCAYGGGVGIIAACDIAIAEIDAQFCFSEARLGLIPAVISPYVIKAIGARQACALFMSAEKFDAQRAYTINLIHKIESNVDLLEVTMRYAKDITNNAPQAVKDCKQLVRTIADREINSSLIDTTASLIAEKRVSPEAQERLQNFLDKKQS